MSNPYKVLVIVPAYNEAESICATVKAVIDSGYDYVVVNDGSTDNTLEICHANHLNVLDLPQNLGIGGAVQAGHKYAKKYGYNIDVQVDGDGQHDPCFISSMVEQIEAGYDLVIGSRFLERTGGFQSTFLRRVGISWLTRVIKMCTGKYIADPTSGFRACGPKAIDYFCKNYPVAYPEPDSIVSVLARGLSVSEIPVVMKERQGGSSSISGFSSAYYMIKVTLAIIISACSKTRC